jgi:CRP-like cAMP-binding protein
MRLEENARNCDAVRAVPLFSSLTNKQKYTLANTVKEMVFTAGECIFRAGDDAQSMYIISEGTVRIQI